MEVVGVWGVVGEGAVVKQNQEVPDGQIAVGVPARILEKPVLEEYKAQWSEFQKGLREPGPAVSR